MDLDQLATFRTVAGMGSFRRAAEALHLSQPAVSKQIQALELELGERLLERGRTVRLTLAGEVLLKYAKRMSHMAQSARDEIADLQELRSGRLSVGASHSIARDVLPHLLESYRARYPHVALSIEVGWSPEIMRRVIARDLDLGLVILVAPGPVSPSQLTCLPLGASEVVFVAAGSAPFVKRKHLTLEDLADVPWILCQDGCQYRSYVEKRFAEQGLALHIAVEVTGMEVQKKLVQLGLGVTLIPKHFVAEELKAGTLRIFRVKGTNPSSLFCLVYRSDKYIHRAMQGLLELLREVLPAGKGRHRTPRVDFWQVVSKPPIAQTAHR
ncbi:MAG: LysR family transcriptional regulator [Candidatus Methylomirabilales bacterium]